MKPTSSNKERFKKFVIDEDHPCIMSQSVIGADNFHLHTYTDFGSEAAAKKIVADLEVYLKEIDFTSKEFFSFIAVFEDDTVYSEIEFEEQLWKQLQHIHEVDDKSWDSTVSSDPTDKAFSFSIQGNAFYVVGLHPNSGRNARKSPKPTMVFNLHAQFEKLREMGVYDRVRNTIRKRDRKKNGSVNPMLIDFGKRSEAPQYSGRTVDNTWECPFKHKADK
ncbi:MAG: YqcI/YcgG family protein [Bacteroidia bacterium]|nr:YqcI/YcgG family protein [Bacteroidia bacterium]